MKTAPITDPSIVISFQFVLGFNFVLKTTNKSSASKKEMINGEATETDKPAKLKVTSASIRKMIANHGIRNTEYGLRILGDKRSVRP